MQCTSPQNYTKNGAFIPTKWPCGKCLPCRQRDRREWAGRLILERKCHEYATFFTLTYDEKNNPGTLDKKHIQNWLKKLRRESPLPVRYYICGEYGSRFKRPHYHGIWFGRRPQLIDSVARRSEKRMLITIDPLIEDTWAKGSTYVKDCSGSTQAQNIMGYVANYILKDSWKENDIEKKRSELEWALQSRKPYIGKPAVKKMYEALNARSGIQHIQVLGTVPAHFTFSGTTWPIARKIREVLGSMLDIPVSPVPYNSGTIIDIDGIKVLNVKQKPEYTYSQAKHMESILKRKISRKRFSNATSETG